MALILKLLQSANQRREVSTHGYSFGEVLELPLNVSQASVDPYDLLAQPNEAIYTSTIHAVKQHAAFIECTIK